MDCPSGRYQPDTAAASCLPCIPGKFKTDAGTTECVVCGTGFRGDACEEADEGAIKALSLPYTYSVVIQPAVSLRAFDMHSSLAAKTTLVDRGKFG